MIQDEFEQYVKFHAEKEDAVPNYTRWEERCSNAHTPLQGRDCSDFKVGNPTRSAPKADGTSSGVVGCSCSRHSFLQPNGIVDLHRDEKWAV